MPKPGDFYVGVLEFFSILLPGAALLALLGGAGLLDEADRFLWLTEPAERYAAFLLGAYAAGHILFLFAAFLDELVYDRVRKLRWADSEGDAYSRAGELRRNAIGGGDRLPMNTFSWAKSYLMLHCPAAWAHVQRHEADSKFFRSMTLLLAIAAGFLLAGGRPGLAVLALALAVFAGLRYVEQRRKSTQWAYQHVIVHHASPKARDAGGSAG